MLISSQSLQQQREAIFQQKQIPHHHSHQSKFNSREHVIVLLDVNFQSLNLKRKLMGVFHPIKDYITQLISSHCYKFFAKLDPVFKCNRQFLLSLSKYNTSHLMDVFPRELWNDRWFVDKLIETNPYCFERASEELQNDRELCLKACQGNAYLAGSLLRSSEKWRSDFDIVMCAMSAYGNYLEYASQELRNNKELAMEAVKCHTIALKYVSENLLFDRELIMEAVKRNFDGCSSFIPNVFANDREIMMLALEQTNFAARFMSTELKQSLEFKLLMVKHFPTLIRQFGHDKANVLKAIKINPKALPYIHEKLRLDWDITLLAIKESPSCIDYLFPELKGNLELFEELVKIKGAYITKGSEEVQNNRKLVLQALKEDINVLTKEEGRNVTVKPQFKNDREVILQGVKTYGLLLKSVSDLYGNDREIVMEAIRNGHTLSSSTIFQNDKEFVMKAIEQNYAAYNYASEELRMDKEVFLLALRKGKRLNDFLRNTIPNILLEDWELLLEAIRLNASDYNSVEKSIRMNPNFIVQAVRKNPKVVLYIPKEVPNRQSLILEGLSIDKKEVSMILGSSDVSYFLDLVTGEIVEYY